MDICAVLTGARCQPCGSQTHQRNDCWYKDETCKTCGKRRYLAKLCRNGNAQTPTHASLQVTGRGPGKGSRPRPRPRPRQRQETNTWNMFVLWKGRDTRKRDCKFKTATCSNCGKVGHLRAGSRNTNTHEIEKDADEPSPEVRVEAVWCMAVRDTVEGGHRDCIERHDVSSEHRHESKFTEFPEHRDGSEKSPRASRRVKIRKSGHED